MNPDQLRKEIQMLANIAVMLTRVQIQGTEVEAYIEAQRFVKSLADLRAVELNADKKEVPPA